MNIPQIFEMLERSKIDPYNPGEIQDFPTIGRQTGHERSGPVAICQDLEALKKVYIFNFDNTVPAFAAYCKARGVSVWMYTPTADMDGEVCQIMAAKTQDCWELWLKEIGALRQEDDPNKKVFQSRDVLERLLKTIYNRPVNAGV